MEEIKGHNNKGHEDLSFLWGSKGWFYNCSVIFVSLVFHLQITNKDVLNAGKSFTTIYRITQNNKYYKIYGIFFRWAFLPSQPTLIPTLLSSIIITEIPETSFSHNGQLCPLYTSLYYLLNPVPWTRSTLWTIWNKSTSPTGSSIVRIFLRRSCEEEK